MKFKKNACLLFVLLYSFTGFSQTVYHFTGRLPASADTNLCDLIFVRFENGTGIARLKFPVTAQGDTVPEMNAQEEYPAMSDEPGGHDKLYFKLSNSTNKPGFNASSFICPVIVFKKEINGAGYEPYGLAADAKGMNVVPFSTSELIVDSALSKDFVLQYFSKNDIFYKNLFGIHSRGLNDAGKDVKLFLLAVTNVNDPSIGSSCAKDRDRIMETFQGLADFLDIGFVPTVISGDNYNKLSVENAIKALNPSGNDIVVFYYSGHGFRKVKDKSNPFPYIDLRPKPDNTYMVNSLSLMNDIFLKIRAKNARLNLVISDCCNDDPGKVNSTGSPLPKSRGFNFKWSEQNCQNLFLNSTRMSIIANAAKPDEEASSNNDFGGFFSYFFKSSMENYFSLFKTDVSWKLVLEEAARQTTIKAKHTYCSKPFIDANICQQTPVYKIF
ncbi:MAG: caspase family protein [Bacteroidota bacterium]